METGDFDIPAQELDHILVGLNYRYPLGSSFEDIHQKVIIEIPESEDYFAHYKYYEDGRGMIWTGKIANGIRHLEDIYMFDENGLLFYREKKVEYKQQNYLIIEGVNDLFYCELLNG